MTTPMVSVILPAYNVQPYIGLAIDSVLAQRFSDWELLIVNDGSTDHTREAIQRYHDARIIYFEQPNGGEAAARNTALDHIHGDYIAFLDGDDLYRNDHLELTINYLTQHPEKDAVYTDGIHIDPQGKHLMSLASRRRGPFEGDLFEQIIRASDVFGPPGCVVVRSAPIVRDHLRFETNIGYGTDWDFWARFSVAAQFGYLNEQTYLYRIHPTNLTLSTDTRKRFQAWSKCRSRAIKMNAFNTCSLEVREAIFYDLLVVLLNGKPEDQTNALQWPEFTDLPAMTQAKLLRLMASKLVAGAGASPVVTEWFTQSHALNPHDWRGRLLFALYRISPALCRRLLNVKTIAQPKRPKDALSDAFKA
jgi:glycosyltransferase involved in cell wall biosynthesis